MNHKSEIATDSSSLILMAKIGIIDYIINKHIIYITQTIFDEAITKGLEKGHKDSIVLKKYIQEGKIKVIEASNKTKTMITRISNLHEGELDAIAIAYEKDIPIICDDRRGRNVCRALQLQLSSTITLLLALYNRKMLNKSQAISKLEQLQKFGWYSDKLIDEIKKKLR